MFGKNKNNLDSGVKKVDKIVTGIIIGGALAGLFGLSQTKKGKEITKSFSSKLEPTFTNASKKTIGIFGKSVAFLVGMFNKKK